MPKETPLPKPLFDTVDSILDDTASCVTQYIQTLGVNEAEQEHKLTKEFLASYAGSADTFTSYRREVERLLQWSWLIMKKSIKQLDRNDIRRYITFANVPPIEWIGVKNVRRFILKQGERITNPEWRPFVVRVRKAQFKNGKTANPKDYQLTQSSLQALFAGISTYFTFLQQESYLDVNPVQLVRQKSRFLQKQQSKRVTRKLSNLQWNTVVDVVSNFAEKNPNFERHLFLMSAFYLLGLRISELAETPGRIPNMGDFAPDKHDRWWFTTVGKGNKIREVAVPDAMLTALKRYRNFLGLSPLPTRGEMTPIISKQRGRGGLGTRQIRNLVQDCFDRAIIALKQDGKEDEALDLSAATVHWLRHTAISADVEYRPREHVRDDAGHENASITDRYIDTDRIARHESAKGKPLTTEE